MLTREQAIEAAFYSGANLCSFVDERVHNLDWMGAVGDDIHLVKREAATIVHDALNGVADDEILTTIVTQALMRQALIEPPRPGHWACWRVFVAVLRACRKLMDEERAAAAAAVTRPSVPAMELIDPEDRIDAPHASVLERISGAPEPRPAKRGKR